MTQRTSRSLQLTLAILKPDLTARPYTVEHVRSAILQNGFIAVRSQQVQLSREKVEQFYQEHCGKFFYNRLVTFMSSGLSHIHVLGREDEAIQKWRQMMGPTKVLKTRFQNPETIRGSFGLTDTRNSTHGSDSETNAHSEVQFFFPEFNVDEFYQSGEDSKFLNSKKSGTLRLDRVKFEHFLC